MSALGQNRPFSPAQPNVRSSPKRSFPPGAPNGCFAPKAVIRMLPAQARHKQKRRHDGRRLMLDGERLLLGRFLLAAAHRNGACKARTKQRNRDWFGDAIKNRARD